MQYPYISIFPEGIDERTYFCDVDLKGQTVMDAYQKAYRSKAIYGCKQFLSQQNKVHHYSADLMNYLEAKIKTRRSIF